MRRHHVKFCQNRSNSGRDMAIFRFFKMVAATILDFRNFKFLTVGRVKSVKLCHRAKFRSDRSNPCRDMTIFQFFLNGGRPPSWICNACVGTTRVGHLVVFITMQNLVGIDAVVLIICLCTFLILRVWLDSTQRVWLENAYSRPKVGGFDPLK